MSATTPTTVSHSLFPHKRTRRPSASWGPPGKYSRTTRSLAASACRKGHAKGPLTLLWGSSDGGERGAAVIRAEVSERA